MKHEFGRLLRSLRESTGFSLGALARHMDVSVTYLSDVERGNRAPLTRERIKEVAEFLGVSPEGLLDAAAEDRGFYELGASDLSPKGKQVGATLMRGWPTYTDEQFEKIKRLLDDLDRMERRRGGKS